jgi:transcriptional regulator with XRE-family HTH domain
MHPFRAYIEDQLGRNQWTQADLARQSGLSKQVVSRLLTDEREQLARLPSQETLTGLARAFRVPLSVVVLKAAQACGVPVDVTEVAVPAAEELTTDQLLAEVRRRIEGGGVDAASIERAGRAGHEKSNVHELQPPPPDEIERAIREGRMAAHKTRPKRRQT